MMKKNILMLTIVMCLVIAQCVTLGEQNCYLARSPRMAHSIADDSIFSSTRNEAVAVGNRTLTFVGDNMTTLFDFRPQLSDDPLLESIVLPDRDAIFYFLGAGETILLAGFNQTMFVEIVLNLTSQYGPISSYSVYTDEGFTCNLTEVVARTLEELDTRQHVLIEDRMHVFLWSGQYGRPTFAGPNNYYIGNATFDEVHWEVFFRTNATQQSVHDQPWEEHEVHAEAMMYFSSNGTLLDFHIVIVPLGSLSAVPWTTILLSGVIMACIVLLVIAKKRS